MTSAPLTETCLLNDGRRLAFCRFGDPAGRPLFLFHGFPGCRTQFLGLHEPGRAAGVAVIAPDRPGFGASDPAPRRTILGWADDVAQLADRLGHARFAVLGISCGGPYALACAHRLAPRLEYAGLLAGIGAMDEPALRAGQLPILGLMFRLARLHPLAAAPLLALDRLMFRRYPRRAAKMIAQLLTPPDQAFLAAHPAESARLAAGLAEAYRQGVAGPARELQLIAGPRGFALQDIAMPVHLYQGGIDRHVPPAMARHMARQLADGRLREYADEGHLSIVFHRFGAVLADLAEAGGGRQA
ncbi:alpha/beta fold hydrolase [Roseateles violae]|uniref:Alpha/beta hydrolase n=1 Tax=Roseateles violae TaxID=3058042 RepID=A0ABT8DZH9_9BURK|nr:alpha/beta hydrolase [Pelomonas sp. PFR6]MDN3922988.1 alpha/beta hydrolase [Pelomonas sp. PFR6]